MRQLSVGLNLIRSIAIGTYIPAGGVQGQGKSCVILRTLILALRTPRVLSLKHFKLDIYKGFVVIQPYMFQVCF